LWCVIAPLTASIKADVNESGPGPGAWHPIGAAAKNSTFSGITRNDSFDLAAWAA
jgi:hypothetical protein